MGLEYVSRYNNWTPGMENKEGRKGGTGGRQGKVGKREMVSRILAGPRTKEGTGEN